MNRVVRFFNKLREEGCTDYEIVVGISDGDIEVPEWMGISEHVNHLKAWDQEEDGSKQIGFFTVGHTKAWDRENSGLGQMMFFDISYTDFNRVEGYFDLENQNLQVVMHITGDAVRTYHINTQKEVGDIEQFWEVFFKSIKRYYQRILFNTKY